MAVKPAVESAMDPRSEPSNAGPPAWSPSYFEITLSRQLEERRHIDEGPAGISREAIPSGAFGTLPSVMIDGFNICAGPAGTPVLLEAVKSEFNSPDQGVIAAQCHLGREGAT